MSSIYISQARVCIEECKDFLHILIRNNPNKRNIDYHRILGIPHFSRKQFLTHYPLNHELYPEHRIRRYEAKYFPTKKFKGTVNLTNEEISTAFNTCLANIRNHIRSIVHVRWLEYNAICNSDLARLLGVHTTTNKNHQAWFTWELIQSDIQANGDMILMKYSDMTPAQQARVQNPHHLKKYIVPV